MNADTHVSRVEYNKVTNELNELKQQMKSGDKHSEEVTNDNNV